MATHSRRCPACGTALPADADPRRKFCSPACVARAYRKRVRLLDHYTRGRRIIRTFAQLTRIEKAGIVSGYLTLPGIQCPVCGKVVWQGVRRRTDAVYCSPACKGKAARDRRRQP